MHYSSWCRGTTWESRYSVVANVQHNCICRTKCRMLIVTTVKCPSAQIMCANNVRKCCSPDKLPHSLQEWCVRWSPGTCALQLENAAPGSWVGLYVRNCPGLRGIKWGTHGPVSYTHLLCVGRNILWYVCVYSGPQVSFLNTHLSAGHGLFQSSSVLTAAEHCCDHRSSQVRRW